MTVSRDELSAIAIEAGRAILDVRARGIDPDRKDDGSLVTEADVAAERIIVARLAKIAPDVPVLAEEAASRGEDVTLRDRFFLVDPLDGTREFVNGTSDFTVNIALIENGSPVMGVVFAPALDTLWAGEVGGTAVRQIGCLAGEERAPEAITCRDVPGTGRIAVASRSHRSPKTQSLLDELDVADCTPAGSSLKFCRVAEAAADVYPRLGRTMEWDTAAGHAVLLAAGGDVRVLNEDGSDGPQLRYRKADRGYDNPHFIAWGRRPA